MTRHHTAPACGHDLARAVTYETAAPPAAQDEHQDGARRLRGRFERSLPVGRIRPGWEHDLGDPVPTRPPAIRSHRLALIGELNQDTAVLLEAGIDALCASGIEELILDLGGLRRLDSTGLRVLAMRCALCSKRGTAVKIDAVQPELQPALLAAGLGSHMGAREAAPLAGSRTPR
jgi:anti-anti-sigma factor